MWSSTGSLSHGTNNRVLEIDSSQITPVIDIFSQTCPKIWVIAYKSEKFRETNASKEKYNATSVASWNTGAKAVQLYERGEYMMSLGNDIKILTETVRPPQRTINNNLSCLVCSITKFYHTAQYKYNNIKGDNENH